MSDYKILHTSDWHIGKKIENFSRLKEQEKFLIFILEFIQKEKIDLLLVAGDIYDSKRPGFEEQRLMNNFFYELSFTCCKWCVIISGNHDKKDYLNINKKLLSKFNFFLISEDDSTKQIVYLKDDENLKFIVACIPHINDRIILGQNIEDISKYKGNFYNEVFFKNLENAYKEKITSIFNSLKDYREIPKILMAHSFFSDNHKMNNIGNSHIIPASVFGNGFSYVALGHIHKFTKLTNNIVYSGSPIQYSFDENSDKYVNVLHFNDNKLILQEEFLVPAYNKLIFIKGSFKEVFNALLNIKGDEAALPYLKIELHETLDVSEEESLYNLAKQNFMNLICISYYLPISEDTLLERDHNNNFISEREVLEMDEKYFFEKKLRKDFENGFIKRSKFNEDDILALFDEVLTKGRLGEYEDK